LAWSLKAIGNPDEADISDREAPIACRSIVLNLVLIDPLTMQLPNGAIAYGKGNLRRGKMRVRPDPEVKAVLSVAVATVLDGGSEILRGPQANQRPSWVLGQQDRDTKHLHLLSLFSSSMP
jgi:hypothetical protein